MEKFTENLKKTVINNRNNKAIKLLKYTECLQNVLSK